MKPICALSTVIENEMKSLCLRDFPCGKGSWRTDDTHETSNKEANTEELGSLIDLLTCSRSPWKYEGSWSDQVAALREHCVRKSECLSDDFVYTFLTSIRVVSLIDEGLLHFSKLEQLVLSVNCISDIPLKHIPLTLQVLELYANEICSLRGVREHHLPCLQHLGLGRNPLGSTEDLQYISSSFWPQLVSLDLSWCGFERLGAMLEAVSTLPCLRTLVLEGNPLVLSPGYPGLMIDRLPRLLYLDGTRVGPQDRHRFKGLATLKDLVLDEAVVNVSFGVIRGVPQPPVPQSSASADFPLVSYNYLVTYQFLTDQRQGSILAQLDLKDQETANSSQGEEVHQGVDITQAAVSADALLMSGTRDESKDSLPVMKYSSIVHSWAEAMDLKHSDTHRIRDLSTLKNFLLQGLWLSVEEEKVTSWPASSSETPGAKSATDKKGSAKEDKKKKKKKESLLELVQEPPVYQSLGSTHLDLRNLVLGQDSVHLLCDLGVLEATCQTQQQQEQGKKGKEEKRKEEKKVKQGDAKGKGKAHKDGDAEPPADDRTPTPVQPLTVEISLVLEKWQSTAQATSTTHGAQHYTTHHSA
ncbi:leucine-rich repeat-containing protein 43-like isoform X2 [Sardina pilchardus]|uniref:leucine-rich repeat-containing protein 43-like isoform X2 n=1 Tax=Sardina pilchardus TaxID=27697 RepID=UPI002E15B334